MTPASLAALVSARVYDLEQPRFAGMPIHPSHKPGYFYALHRRHRDTYQPECHGPRSGASGTLVMMEHSGTHIDALSHQAAELTLFGGVRVEAAETPAGFTQLGVETVPPLLGSGLRFLISSGSHGIRTSSALRQAVAAMPAEITPNVDFYCMTKDLIVPSVSTSVWRLRIGGLVERPRSYRFDDVRALPGVRQVQTLECISNGVGAGLMSNAAWTGVTDLGLPFP